jgi:cytochrome c-type biogenesis protein CcmE
MQNKGWQQDMLKEGQQITVQGYRAKSEPFVAAARMITLPDGKSMSSADDDDGGPKN